MAVQYYPFKYEPCYSALTPPIIELHGSNQWMHPLDLASAHSDVYTGNPRHKRHSQPPASGFKLPSRTSLFPRGPPPKPKLSEYAVWVGNLPENCRIEGLRDYFAQDSAASIISIRLISRTRCAFVNYKTQAACLAAIARFHGIPYHGNRLVCKLRRCNTKHTSSEGPQPDINTVSNVRQKPSPELSGAEPGNLKRLSDKAKGRFFVLKSLTIADLQNSIVSGLWSTQPHVEPVLDAAYADSEAVFLIFSVNKSGEFFGYAQMRSPIGSNHVPASHNVAQTHDQSTKNEYKIPTAATATAPAGYITDDPEREIHFWEADIAPSDPLPPTLSSPEPNMPCIVSSDWTACKHRAEIEQTTSASYFRIQWISLRRVPFYRMNGLRNSFNHNRPVQVARDGTEIDVEAAESVITCFHT